MKNYRHIAAKLLLSTACVSIGFSAFAQQSAEQELAGMQPAADCDVSLFAAEPMVANPAAIDVDSHGRVWVAEIQWYRSQAKQPPADKIKVLEDTDGDGKADKVTTFADELFCPMSVCVAGDKVYVATSPDLWEFEDKNGDLQADGPPRKLLTGFGGMNHDHGAHSLVLGPDHKWWMSIGDEGLDVTGVDGSRVAYEWGAIVRGELDGTQLETVASNFRNPYELCLSSFGEAFVSDNDNDGNESTRFCWILEGGNYGWYGGPPQRTLPGTPRGEHWHFRGHVPGHVPALLATGFGAPSGMCFYEGDAWGETMKNVALLADAGPREVRLFRTRTHGIGMQATHEVLLTSADSYFRPDDVCAGPDGSLYVADWYDGGVGGHAYNNAEQGRIFVLRPRNGRLERDVRPGPYKSTGDAMDALTSPNLATQYLARERLLAGGQSSVPIVAQLLDHDDPNIRARALWLLDRLGGDGRAIVQKQLTADDPAFRALAVRILRRHGKEYLDAILPLADDSSGEVVREVLLALRGAQSPQASEALARIAGRYDGADRYLLEAINIVAADRKHELYEQLADQRAFEPERYDLLQLLNPDAARDRLREDLLSGEVDEQTFPLLLHCASTMSDAEVGKLLLEFVARKSVAPAFRARALETIAAHLDGEWSALKEGDQLAATLRSALASAGLRQAALAIIDSRQMQSVDDDVMRLAADGAADAPLRCAAIKTAVGLGKTDAKVEALRKLLIDPTPTVREAAVTALVVHLQDAPTTRELLNGAHGGFTTEIRDFLAVEALNTPGGANMLLAMVEDDGLDGEMKQRIVAQAIEHPDANVRSMFEQFVPPEQRQKRLGEAISATEILKLEGDPQRGDAIFHQNSAAQCMNCHKVHGKGGAVGPELSSIGRKYDRPQLLETIMAPSKAIAPEYVSYAVETQDGRVLGGLLVEQSDEAVVLKDIQGHVSRIPRDNVEAIVAQSISMMPELVLRDISAQDAADLLAYLATLR